MGLRFRKSIKIAPGVKVNLNKDSVSTTIGSKGAHYTVNSKGKRTSSVGIPGTGISYVKTSSKGSSKKASSGKGTSNTYNIVPPEGPENNKKGKGCGRGCLSVFLILLVIGFIGAIFDKDIAPESLALSANTESAYDINDDIPITLKADPSDADLDDIKCNTDGGEFKNDNGKLIFTAKESGTYDMYVSYGSVESNIITINVEDKAAIAKAEKKTQEAAAKKKAEEEATAKKAQEAANQKKAEEEATAKKAAEEAAAKQAEEERIAAEVAAQQAAEQAAAEQAAQQAAAAQASQQPQERMVWIPQTGSKYHSNSSCSGMNNPSQVSVSDAESLGFTPCKKCY